MLWLTRANWEDYKERDTYSRYKLCHLSFLSQENLFWVALNIYHIRLIFAPSSLFFTLAWGLRRTLPFPLRTLNSHLSILYLSLWDDTKGPAICRYPHLNILLPKSARGPCTRAVSLSKIYFIFCHNLYLTVLRGVLVGCAFYDAMPKKHSIDRSCSVSLLRFSINLPTLEEPFHQELQPHPSNPNPHIHITLKLYLMLQSWPHTLTLRALYSSSMTSLGTSISC